VTDIVKVVHGERGGHPISHHHEGGYGIRQDPGSGQRRDSPPLLHATQRRA
jgi:hypothetical protein